MWCQQVRSCPTYTSSRQRKDGRAAAVRASVPSRWRYAPEPLARCSVKGRGHAAPVPPPGRPLPYPHPRPARLCAHRKPYPGLLSGSRPDPRDGPLSQAGAMALPRSQARGWVKAAKMAQRRRRAEDAGGPQGPAPGSQRAALYVHVSGDGRRGGGSAGPRAPVALVTPRARLPSFTGPRRGLGPVPWRGKVLPRRTEVSGVHNLVDLGK